MGYTFAEKALARAAGLEHVVAGQIIDARPDVALSHDNTAAIAKLFRSLGYGRVLHPERLAIFLDHAVPAPSAEHALNHKEVRRVRGRARGRAFLRRGPRHLPPGDQRRGAGSAGPTAAGRGQPYTAHRLAGRVRRRHRPQRDGRDLGHGRALAARAGDDPGRFRGGIAAGRHVERSGAVGAEGARPRGRHLPRAGVRRAGPAHAEHRKPHGAPESDGRIGREKCLSGAGRRGVRVVGATVGADSSAGHFSKCPALRRTAGCGRALSRFRRVLSGAAHHRPERLGADRRRAAQPG